MEQLATLYEPRVRRWLHRHFDLQAEDAEDVVQEVFSVVLAKLADFRRDQPGDSFRGWLWTVTRSKAIDLLRRRRNRPQAQGGTDAQQWFAQIPEQLPDSEISGPGPGERHDLLPRVLDLARAGVEDRTWQAFWRVVVDGHPVRHVAEDLEMSVRAVYDAKYRVLRNIRRELDDLGEL